MLYRKGLQTFSTVAAARATTVIPQLNDKILIKSLSCYFSWDDTSTATDDGLLIIKQTNTVTGRFINETVQIVPNKEVTTNYTVTAADSKTTLWATADNSTFTFSVDGLFNLNVRAYPVMILSTNTASQTLDAGDYFISVVAGVLTLK